MRGLVGLVGAGILSAFALLLLNGQYRTEGPVILTLSEGHGIHRGDVLVAGGWLIGLIAIGVLVFERPHD